MADLRNKTAIVTGGGRDIGQAVVVELARLGALVAFSHNSSDPAATISATAEMPRRAIAHPMDAGDSQSIHEFVEWACAALDRPVDILVNVAGGLVARRTVAEMDEKFWDQVMDLNLKSTFLVCKYALPKMTDGGAIVNFSSQAARDGGGPGSLAYATSKAGVSTFTRGLAKELGGRRIRVNAVCPGMIDTTFHDTFTKPEVRQRVATMTPVGREGKSEEVAKLVAFLASPEASFVNGACVDINGGILFS